MLDFLEIPLVGDDLPRLAFWFGHNVLFLFIVVRLAWHVGRPDRRDADTAFAAVMLNITVFFICFTMKKLELSLGMALGLFAIFGVLRYRTSAVQTKDLTYLFIVIGIAVINALCNTSTSYLELLAANSAMAFAAILGERLFVGRRSVAQAPSPPSNGSKQRKQTIEYDTLELLAPDRYGDLLSDLRDRTHLTIVRARVASIDLTSGRATLTAWSEGDVDESAS